MNQKSFLCEMVLCCIALMSTLTACAREPEKVSLTAIAYNYGEAYARLNVNGQWAGGGSNSVQPGDVTGGGGICCIELSREAKTVKVEVMTGLKKSYTVSATVEQPFRNLAHYAAIHILPGRKIVISITALHPSPRSDLLNQTLQEMDVKNVEILDPHLWDVGPEIELE